VRVVWAAAAGSVPVSWWPERRSGNSGRCHRRWGVRLEGWWRSGRAQTAARRGGSGGKHGSARGRRKGEEGEGSGRAAAEGRGGTAATRDTRNAHVVRRCRGQIGLGDPGKYWGVTRSPSTNTASSAAPTSWTTLLEPAVVDAVLHQLPVVVAQRAAVDVEHERGGVRRRGAEHLHHGHPRRAGGHVAVALELPHAGAVVLLQID